MRDRPVTIGLKLDLSDLLPIIIDPYDVPLFERFAQKAPTQQAAKHEWLEEPLVASSDPANDTLDASETILTVTEGGKFKAGNVIRVLSTGGAYEVMRVASVSGNDLTVARGYAGTVAATTAANPTVDIIGYAVADGADPAPFNTTNRNPLFNYQQTFQELIEVTDLDQWTQVYGIGDKFSHEVEKWLKTLAIRAERAMLFGQRYEDPANKTRTMGGLDFFIQTNATAEGGVDIDEDLVNGHLQDIYTAGGQANLIAVSPTQKRKISALISSSMRWYPRPGTAETVGVSADE